MHCALHGKVRDRVDLRHNEISTSQTDIGSQQVGSKIVVGVDFAGRRAHSYTRGDQGFLSKRLGLEEMPSISWSELPHVRKLKR